MKKQGPAIFLTLKGNAQEAILELDIDKINVDNGVDNIIAKLDTLYLRDKVQTAYECYDTHTFNCCWIRENWGHIGGEIILSTPTLRGFMTSHGP